ncbi:hypothetical protein M0813_22044 [Anaeramoeba flamelloides]|uniref:Uncharacterized protein n=1 Tax=Anaeramoeba flamelloides TaxID=1746091 RepID=A0ABQ8YG78_9EUKA|nr:hypothetical protein M0813_22044 [Anaeramoeba flamelloides]
MNVLKFGPALMGLLLLVTIQSTHYFLFKLKVPISTWLVINACAPSNYAYLLGRLIDHFTGTLFFAIPGIVPMFSFGTLGLFVFSWKGFNIIPQISHLIMTANTAFTIYEMFLATDRYFQSLIAVLVGVGLFVPFIFAQNHSMWTDPEKQKILFEASPVSQNQQPKQSSKKKKLSNKKKLK